MFNDNCMMYIFGHAATQSNNFNIFYVKSTVSKKVTIKYKCHITMFLTENNISYTK